MITPETKTLVVATIDATALFCPLPIVKLKKAIEKIPDHKAVEIWADDPAFPDDVVAWCQETQNQLLFLSQRENGVFVAVIEKNEKN